MGTDASGNSDADFLHDVCDPNVLKIHRQVEKVRNQLSDLVQELDKVL